MSAVVCGFDRVYLINYVLTKNLAILYAILEFCIN
jgi:hypothetical protein